LIGSSPDPRLERRRQAFIDAARRSFIDRGFEDTSLAAVVVAAGGSLATLYKLFGSKAGLLAAVVQERVQSGEELIAEIGMRHSEPRAALVELGKRFRRDYFDEEAVAITRIVIAYSLKDPEFASSFSRETILRSQQALAALFRAWRSQGIALTGKPEALAALFLGMFIHELHSDAISHGALAASEYRDLDAKIDFFCRGAGLLS
jgi:TetR/AcrR family transcriptional regulator, mexJK operon transcriptional repressor